MVIMGLQAYWAGWQVQNWQVCNLGDDKKLIICLNRNNDEINLEPGGQIEFSFSPKNSIREIEETYNTMINDLEPILKDNNYNLITLGYQPVTKINELKILPKKRYKMMFDHFKKKRGSWLIIWC